MSKYFVHEGIGETGKPNQMKWIPVGKGIITIYEKNESLYLKVIGNPDDNFHCKLNEKDMKLSTCIIMMCEMQKRIEFFLNSNLAFFYAKKEFEQALFEHNSKKQES